MVIWVVKDYNRVEAKREIPKLKLESEQKEGEVAVRGYLQEFQYGKEMVQTTTMARKKLNKLESLFQQINN